MRRLATALLLGTLLAGAAAPMAAAHGGGGTMRTLMFTAYDGTRDGETVSWFRIDNRSNPNPRITVNPGERIVLHVANAGDRRHNLRVAPPVMTATPILDPGNETSISMKVPQDAAGTFAYYDQVHREDGAEGRFRVAGAHGSHDDGGSPLRDPLVGAGLVGLVLVGVGWWSGRRG